MKTHCRHFNGLINDQCKAGITYHDVRDDTPPGRRFSCHPNFMDRGPASIICPAMDYFTDAELEEQEKAIAAAVSKFIQDLKADICPHCGQAILQKVQVGRCVYARPCGDRLYQGGLDSTPTPATDLE